jgi:hypothetical protein
MKELKALKSMHGKQKLHLKGESIAKVAKFEIAETLRVVEQPLILKEWNLKLANEVS